jgi:transposase
MIKNTFFYEDGHDNVYNEDGEKVFDPMEGVLTEVNDPNVILETITSQKSYLSLKPAEKETTTKDTIIKVVELSETADKGIYNDYSDQTREVFIDRMIEGPMERGKVTLHAKDLGINPRTAMRWWKHYEETGEVAYKKSQRNPGRPNSFTPEHEQYIQQILDKDSQLCADDIIGSLTSQFENFQISKSQMNHHLKNNMLISIKKPTFDPKIRNSDSNLQTRYEWFMKWKDSDPDYTKNCIFIDEAGFNINMRNNWARSAVGTPAPVEIEKTRSPSHTIIGAIHCTSVLHVVMKKPPPKKQRGPKTQTAKTVKTKKRKLTGGQGHRPGDIIISEPTIEYVDVDEATTVENNKPVAKGTTTAHFIKFMNELLDIMDVDRSLMGSYLVMDNCTIHKSHPMIRKIESRGYRVMYLSPYSPELNPIEQFWALVKGKMKRHRLMNEENLSQRIADACNDVRFSDLQGFSRHSKEQIINCYNKTSF